MFKPKLKVVILTACLLLGVSPIVMAQEAGTPPKPINGPGIANVYDNEPTDHVTAQAYPQGFLLYPTGSGGVSGRLGDFGHLYAFNNTKSSTDPSKDKSGGPCSGNYQGDPIDISKGTKLETYPIFSMPGEMGLKYELYYTDRGANRWSDNLAYSLDLACSESTGNGPCRYVAESRPDGSEVKFTGKPGVGPYTEQGGGALSTLSYNASTGQYTLQDEQATTEVFDSSGALVSIKDASGIGWTISGVSGNPSTRTVTHTNGQSFTLVSTFTAGSGQTLYTFSTVLTDPANNTYTLHETGANYDSISFPGSPATVISLKYAIVNSDTALSEVDYNGTPYAYTTYRSDTSIYNGWATGTHLADGSQGVTIGYATDGAGNVQATVTNALGHQSTQTYDGTNGNGGAYNGQLSSVNHNAVADCGATVNARQYDGNGNLQQTVDNNGNVHTYTYAANGQLQTETEAYGTTQARTTDYVWDSNQQLNRLTSVTIEGWSRTAYTYNAQNRLASVAVTNLSANGSANQTLTTTYNYTLYANGMVHTLSVTHPSPNSSNTDVSTYDALGNLTSFADGLSHTTTYGNYNGLGEVGHVVEPNGDATDVTYDARGRVVTKTTYPYGTAAKWAYTYDGFGLLYTLTTPDNAVTTWNRNAEMMVQTITRNDKDGTSTETVGYDQKGDVTSHVVTRGNDVGLKETATYDALGRLYQKTGNHGQSLTYAYDGNGNVTSVTDALNDKTSYQYDALDRRSRVVTTNGGTTQTVFDRGDNVASVTDPLGLVTTYAHDGLGLLWQQVSPDAGTTRYTYDGSGRAASMQRADGTQTTYSYDGINRTTSRSAGGQTQSFVYDNCGNGLGRLCSAGDATGTTSYAYTPEGWISGRGFSVAGTTYALGYSYDGEGRLATVSYPDGNKAIYNRSNGVVSSVVLTVGNANVTGASGITYRPGNLAMASWTSGNGLSNTASYDSDLRLVGLSVPGVQNLSFGYDAADRLTGITNGMNGNLTQALTYNAISRLIGVSSNADNESYKYDPNGNRTSGTVNGQAQTYTTATGSNALVGFQSSLSVTYGYDAQGNTSTVNGTAAYQYDAFNRLTHAGGATSYINPEGQRLRKSGGSTGTTYFAPDTGNQLMAENANGTWVDYVRLNGRLIGRISGGQVYAIHADQVGRPEEVTNANQAVVWRAQNLPFGSSVTTANGVTLNLGFPGQYYDAETWTWNNGYRDYNSGLGKYLETDPIGQAGGINPYAYVGNSPLMYVDPFGLEWQASVGVGVTGAFLFGGGGGSVNVGITSNGSLFFQAEGHGEVGLGAYLGAGVQGGVSHTKCDSTPGWSQSTTGIAEGDAGYGPSVGGSGTFNGHDVGASTGLGRFGVGGGIWAGAGASHAYTYTTPSISQMWNSLTH